MRTDRMQPVDVSDMMKNDNAPVPADAAPANALAPIETVLKEREAHILRLYQDLSERDAQLIEVYDRLARCEQSLIRCANHEGELRKVKQSSSWRLTRPLRQISTVVQGLKRGMGPVGAWRVGKEFARFDREGPAPAKQGGGDTARSQYGEWIRQFDTLTDADRQVFVQACAALPYQPLISVVMPTYNPDPVWLAQAIESVRSQLYSNWELCIADDASTDEAALAVLRDYQARDARIKVAFRTENGHISKATNSALALASGEWVALLDHDDLLTEHALAWNVLTMAAHPRAQLIFSDEDKIAESGERVDPYFKSEWNRALFYSHNMITHLGVYRRDLLTAIGGFRHECVGAQDYDLALRCIERIDDDQIVHIPRILYHWRVHAGSTANAEISVKPYAMFAGERALNEHFQRMGMKARSQFVGHGYRARYALPEKLPLVSIVIPTRDKHELVQLCVDSIWDKTRYPNFEILLIDNGSEDPLSLACFDGLAAAGKIRLLRYDKPFNYSAINNFGVANALGEVICLLNNDIEVISADWLGEMVSLALQPTTGAVGAKLLYPDETVQHAGVICGIGGWAGHAHKGFPAVSHGYAGRATLINEFSAVTGACMVVSKAKFDAVGGLDEAQLKVACNDVDLSLKLRAQGLHNIFTPYALLYHHESATRGYEDNPEKIARFEGELAVMHARWGKALTQDPCYSPNLSLSHEDFSLAWPPRVERLPRQ
jgi:glycosyltransferase involved in cell wall biosynthesis